MGKGGCTAAGRAARSKAQGQPDLSEGCVRRDDAYKVFILIRFLLHPNQMRRRHLESVSSRSLSVRGSWGTAPSVFWYGAPGGTRGPLGKGGAAERWRVTPSVSGGDPTWSAARDDAYAQKERPGGEPYRLCTLQNQRPAARRPLTRPQNSFAHFSSQKSSPRRRRPPPPRGERRFPSPPQGFYLPRTDG